MYAERGGFQQLALKEELLKIPDGKFWIGSDLRTSHPITLLPHIPTIVRINVTPDNLPDNRRLIRQSRMSGRSIFMQLGIEVGSETPEILDWTLEGKGDTEMTAAIPLENVGNRIVKIPEGTGVGSLYLWNGKTFTNDELESLVKSGEIRMSGDEGKDWRYSQDKDGRRSGIMYRVDPDFRKYIPPSSDVIDMSHFSTRNDRPKIDKLLKDVPESDEPIDWITQTRSSVGLSENVHAIIEPSLNDDRLFDASHRNSLLLKGGDEWPIRLELVSPTVEGFLPSWVLFRFVKATQK